MPSLDSLERETANHQEEVEEWTDEEIEQSYPFLSYAARYILHHMEDAEMGGVSQLELLKKLRPGSKGIQRLRRSNEILHGYDKSWIDGIELMHRAASMGLYEIFRTSLEKIKVNIDVVGGFYGIALQAAVVGGHEKIVQLCLKYGANVDTISGEYGTALQGAAFGGHEKIVQRCLEYGADVNITGGRYYTALRVALVWINESIARTLLEHGADLNAWSSRWGTALTPPTEKERQIMHRSAS